VLLSHGESCKRSHRTFRQRLSSSCSFFVEWCKLPASFVKQIRRQSRRLLCADGFYSSSLEELGRFLYRGQRQQLLHFAVCKDDVGGALQCLIVTPFISVPEF
jgi:hypothetical protein